MSNEIQTLKQKYREVVAPQFVTDGFGERSSFVDLIVKVLTQKADPKTSVSLNSSVIVQGRFVERASGSARAPHKKKIKKIELNVEALTGDEVFIRPNKQKYVARKWGENNDVLTLRKTREKTSLFFKENVGSPMFSLLYGAPGCGKTALIEAAFANQEGGVFTLMGTGDIEVSDLIGGYIQTPSGGFEWADGDLLKAAETGGVYFIDEIGLIDPKVLSVIYGLMDGRREYVVTANPERGVVKAHSDFYVVAATNPNAPGVRLSEALLSRFIVQAEMTTDWDLARSLGVPATMVSAAQNLYRKQLSNEVSWSPQMRELLGFRDVAEAFGVDFAIANLLAGAPEIDRAVVTDVLTRAFGDECKPARI
jgi:hypothetical protein